MQGKTIPIYNVSYSVGQMSKKTPEILLDSGANAHIICNQEYFTSFDPEFCYQTAILELADGSTHNLVKGKGTAVLHMHDNLGYLRPLTLKHALLVPEFNRNILSLKQGIANGM